MKRIPVLQRGFSTLTAILAVASLVLAGVLAGGASTALADDSLTFTTQPVPVIDQSPYVGENYYAGVSGWAPDPDSYSYQWFRDGTAVAGATTVEYSFTSDDLGAVITFSVTAHKAGYLDATQTSDPSDPVGPAQVSAGQPTVSGTPSLDQTLTADSDAADWSPVPTSFSYQWYNDGGTIDGADQSTYTVARRDVGQLLSVRVVGHHDGYTDGTAYSDAVRVDGTGYSVTGTLTGEPGGGGGPVPLQSMLVELYQGTNPSSIAYAYTDQDGRYELDFGPDDATATYTLEFNRDADPGSTQANYVHVWLGNQSQQDQATQFTLSPSVPSATEDVQLDRGATVSGLVTDSDGNPIPGAQVQITPPGLYGGQYATTDSQGKYTITGVSATETIVSANAVTFSDSALDTKYYNNQWWDHSSTLAGATPLDIVPGSTLPDIDFALTDEATVTGRVVDSDGNGVPYMSYVPWHYNPVSHLYVSPREGPFLTDADGYFRQPANGWSSYKFSFDDELGAGSGVTETRTPFDTVWYDNAASFATATPVDLPGESSQVDIGNVVVTSHTGGPSFVGAPQIDDSDFASDNLLELTGVGMTPGTATQTVRWNRDGTPIPGATDWDYTPVADDQGHELTATLTASLDGFPDATVTTAPFDLRNSFVSVTPPAISGTPTVGQTLTALDGSWTPTQDSTSYQWFRTSGSADPVAISGATNATYTLTADDFGDSMTVAVTASAAGYKDSTLTAGPTAIVAAGSLISSTPTISGTLAVGSQLTAAPGTWGPGTVTFAYQWVSGSTDIPGATSSTYTPVASDAGAALSVRVTGSETGYASASHASTQTATITQGTLSTGTPTILGTPTVGQMLTALPGTWGPGSVDLAYQWVRGSTDILGANASTYELTGADAGEIISVRVTGSEAGYASAAEISAATTAVAAGTLSAGTPSISGTAAVGSTLTASPGSWGPGTVSFTYQWVRGSTDIPDATDSTYAPTGADAGETISVRVTGSEAGYGATSATSAPTGTVEAGSLTTGIPAISGTASVGQMLTADPGTWAPGTVSFSYQWVRGSADIADATGSTYTLVEADAGEVISVRVTGEEAGYGTTSVTSAPTVTVDGGTLSAGTPTVAGAATYGSTLTANPGTWGPGAVSFDYQWLRDGAAIDGATDSTYVISAADVGAQLSVTVTATEAGFDSQPATSPQTDAVTALDFTDAPTVSIAGPSILGKFTASVGGDWTPLQDSYSYQWFRNDEPIDGATASVYQSVGADVGQSVTVDVTAARIGYRPSTIASLPVTPTFAVFTAHPTPTISGSAQVGQTLTVSTGAWSPTPDSFEYRWQYGPCDAGAAALLDPSDEAVTTSTYVIQPADAGKTICATVTASATGYNSLTEVTASTATVQVAPLTTDTPMISGTAAVGQTLTADAGNWGPGTVNFAYQWYRDNTAIASATDSTYAVTGSDVGHSIHVTVVGSEPGYSTSAAIASAATDEVTPAVFGGTQAVALSGIAAVGRTITETVTGTLTPSPEATTVTWQRDGVAIDGAPHRATYVLTAADAGKAITASVTSTATGYLDYSATSAPISPLGSFTSVPTPTISGTAKLGATLTAVSGTWAPTTSPATTFDYAWRVNGLVVQDGAEKTYLATTDDVGYPITVTVSGSATGYTQASATSLPTAKVVAGTIAGLTPKISGTAKVQDTLTVSTGAWSPTPDSYSYQWYRSGTAISGATAASYQLTGSEYAKTITVTVTAHLRGYTSLAKSSSATAKVAAGVITKPVTGAMALSTAVPTVGVPVTADTSAWGPAPVTFYYQWYDKATTTTKWTAISKATGASYTPTGSLRGEDLAVSIKATKTGYTASAAVLSESHNIGYGTVTTTAPTISGTAAIGSTLTAGHTGWAPTTATFHYQWYRVTAADPSTPVAIAGATASTYKVTTTDAESTIEVAVSATATGYTASSAVLSGQTTKVMTPFTVVASGTAKSGKILTAITNPEAAPDGATYTYQWYYVSGSTSRAISGKTAQTYTISSSYRGKTIKVLVRATVAGYGVLAVYSKTTAKVA